MESIFFYIGFGFFCIATFFFIIHLITLKNIWSGFGNYAILIAIVSYTLYLIFRGFIIRHFPVTSVHEGLVLLCLLLGILFLVFFHKYKLKVVGVFLAPLATFFSLIALLMKQPPMPVLNTLQSFWLPIHVGSIFIGNALFSLSFVFSVVYIIENFRLKKKKFDNFGKQFPSLTTLDNINYMCIVYGFPFMTLGMITGAIWAQYAVGSYWNNDPKEIWSLITWMLYAAILHCRLISGWRGKKIAVFSIVAFLVLVFSFVGVTYLFKGYHIFRGI